ncbi:MAG: ATP-binding protein [Bacteroidales bacterium]|nr:ATP-binding protein [Bacteroidales bacterium]
MERKALNDIIKWNQRQSFKPLVLNGARQVGKTWLMKEFANRYYPGNYVYINFEDEEDLKTLFQQDFDISRIETTIKIVKAVEINKDTLFLFDEIQEAKRGTMALKYFYEKEPERRIIAAGSMLGLSLHKDDSFPVGKVSLLNVYPLDFEEFLWATNNKILDDQIVEQQWSVLGSLKNKTTELLKLYYFIGGMPRVVLEFINTNDLNEVRREQTELLASYQLDFSKHAPTEEVPRIRMVWASIPSQLAKENRKFIYGALKKGGRAKEFEIAIEWLRDAGLIYKVNRVSTGEMPLSAFVDLNAFKIYMLDTGLLGAMANLSPKAAVLGNDLFMTYRGALTEQYVYQQMRPLLGEAIYYWSADNSRGEVDFVIEAENSIVPIEVKAEENLRSKSLRAFCDKCHLNDALRFSLADYRRQDYLTNVPLYAVGQYLSTLIS